MQRTLDGRAADGVLPMLRGAVRARGLDALAGQLAELEAFSLADLASCGEDFARAHAGPRLVHRSAGHLVSLGGKRLRPLCVSLAARAGDGFGPAARHVAVAAELVHSATLLHDDVVDFGDSRRGAPTARLVYGNAASIFAGDWLLVAALRHVREAGIDGLLEGLLGTLEAMIAAESVQLEQRGGLGAGRGAWLEIAEGKTASLFAWCFLAGARAGGADAAKASALQAYGRHLGLAFQLADDLLDYAGEPSSTGKALFADLREGKPTFPLVVALERDPSIAERLGALAAGEVAESSLMELSARVRGCGALDETRAFATSQAERALAALAGLGLGAVGGALEALASSVVHRDA